MSMSIRLETKRLVLREQTLADVGAANAYESQPDVVRWTSHGCRTIEESRADIERVRAARDAQPRRIYDLAITLRSGGPMIGRAGLGIESNGLTSAVWHILHPAHQGSGIACEAVREMVRLGFEQLGLQVLECCRESFTSLCLCELRRVSERC